MAASPVSSRELRSKETSPNSALLLTPKLLSPRLPPIVSRAPRIKAKPPQPPPPTPEPWSYYHRHCQRSPKYHSLPRRWRYNPNKGSRAHCRSWSSEARRLFNELGRRLRERGCDPRAGSYVVQQVSIAVQRGNAAGIMGIFEPDFEIENFVRKFLNEHVDFICSYVSDEIATSTIEDWLEERRELERARTNSMSDFFNTPNTSTTNTSENNTDSPPQEASTSGSPPQKASTSGSPPQKASTSGSPPQKASTSGSPPQKASTSGSPPQKASTSGSPPQKASVSNTASSSSSQLTADVKGKKKQQRLSPQVPVKPNNKRDKAIQVPDLPDTRYVPKPEDRALIVELPSSSQQSSNVRPKFTEYSYPPKPSIPPKAHSANGTGRPRRMLPGFVNGSDGRRTCAMSGSRTRQELRKPVLDENMKNITAMVEDLVVKIFPDASIEMYLVDQQDVYCLLRDSLEFISNPHERIIKQVMVKGRPWFLNQRDLLRVSVPPKQYLQSFNKQINVALIPLRVNFGTIVIEVRGEAFDAQVMVLLQSLQQIVDITLPYHQQSQSLLQESKMSAFLLQVAQAVFEEMLSLDQLIKKILEVAQRLVSADRASLFLVDHRNSELVSTVFDLRYEANPDSDFSKKEIRMPINKGIAGHVALSGETLNIPDAYLDKRFNKAVDEATGYHTVSILCMPIKVRGKVLAVVQMVNKRDEKVFGPNDETAFQVFSTFFGLALHHAKLYDKIKIKEQKYKVALEVLGYHNACCEEDVAKVLEERTEDGKINYNDFALNPFEVDEIDKCKSILNMFEDLFDMTMFDLTVLTRFVLTVKKNYRKVPYHNFDHGWAVANSMYVMLKNDTDSRFDFNNRLALFVACLCHDLDHRGYTNKFMNEIDSPLAAIYTTSTLEHHHFNMTVTILQQDGHNIFYRMSGEEYKYILDSIRQCILATDLAAFFPNLKKINELVFETPQFDWDDASHRALGRSFCMTSADLSASAKPFTIQLKTVAIIVAEFYQQGDLERQAGRSPVPMMDRRCQEQVPACQVGFLSQICLPCYQVLAELFPSTKPMLDMVTANLETWKKKAIEIKRKNEAYEQEDIIAKDKY